MAKVEAIIFDCFGVVLGDVLTRERERLLQTDPEKSQQLHDLMRAVDLGAMSPPDAQAAIAELLGLDLAGLQTLLASGEVVNEPLLDYIKTLRPRYKLGMLSNISSRARIEMRLPDHDLDDYFDLVIVSGEIGFAKPDPQAYDMTLARLGVTADEAIFIDDNQGYIEGAKAAGLPSIHFVSTLQATTELNAYLDAHR